MRVDLALLLCLIAAFPSGKVEAATKKYDGFKVLRVKLATEQQLKSLVTLEQDGLVDLWMKPRGIGSFADIMVSPDDYSNIESYLITLGIKPQIWIENVEAVISKERSRMASRQKREMNWEEYQTYETIMEWLDSLVATNDFITSESFGTSTQNRDLRIFKLSTGGTGKPALWIDATIHAREWISTSTITYIINQLVTTPNNYTDILDTIDFYFVPFINPDGYVFSHSGDRLWRKTRSNYGNYTGNCVGVDANRNFGFHYGEDGGSSANPCSLTYRGPLEYSEPECEGVRNYILSRASSTNWTAFITLHSYSQLWMSPYGYSATILPPDYPEMKTLSDQAVEVLASLYGSRYLTGNAGQVLYTSTGTSRDWAKGEGGFKWVYTIELRDTGTHGFLLPPDQILPTAEETWAGIQVVARKLIIK